MDDAKAMAELLREAVNTIMHYQFTHSREAMHALQVLIDEADNAAALLEQQAAELEALRPKREHECLTLDDWRIRAMDLEANWSRCSATCAKLQGERDALRAKMGTLHADLLASLEEPDAELMDVFQEAFTRQLRRRKHSRDPYIESAEKAGIRAMLKHAISAARAGEGK